MMEATNDSVSSAYYNAYHILEDKIFIITTVRIHILDHICLVNLYWSHFTALRTMTLRSQNEVK